MLISSVHPTEQWIRELPRSHTEIQLSQRFPKRKSENVSMENEGIHQNNPLVRRLDYPRTVCASERCRSVTTNDDQLIVDFISRDHDHCFLKRVAQKTLGLHE